MKKPWQDGGRETATLHWTVTVDQSAAAEHAEGARVLIVEDEPHIRDLVALHLRLEGLTIVAVGDGNEGLRYARAEPFDVIVLDLMLPGLDGVTVCRAIRREPLNSDVPILMLTARREESDKVLGLESGADDYLTKPFGVRELVARVRALLRRPRASKLAERRRQPRRSRSRCTASTSIPRGASRDWTAGKSS